MGACTGTSPGTTVNNCSSTFSVESLGRTPTSAGVEYSFRVCKLGTGPQYHDLSHFSLDLDTLASCAPAGASLSSSFVSCAVDPPSTGTCAWLARDPTTQIGAGVKFDNLQTSGPCGTYRLSGKQGRPSRRREPVSSKSGFLSVSSESCTEKPGLVAGAIRRSATRRALTPSERAPVDVCADYLLKYQGFMRYHEYLAAGLPIATGVIEGACRHLVKGRMEITGARWGLEGAEAILRLRSLRASGDFEEYWTFHEEQEHHRNHASRYADGKIPIVEPPTLAPGKPRLRLIK